ncbi:hypothetical protein [Lysobacter sp. 1R34A]|uniref:hypothetical protein n=1 Tax=Lysobacter sp. 1R34A TaxID=3445786 RepID=UPI003EECF494
MDANNNVPVFIVSYNRLKYLKALVDSLERLDFRNIIILDNASTYPPLLEYLDASPHRVERLSTNLGHLALWKSGRFREIIDRHRYILTDCDVVPSPDCPGNIVEVLGELLDKYPRHTKAGLSLKIDDLPDTYAFKQQVIEWELPFWEHKLEDGNYEGAIDTTFALYRPGIYCEEERWWRSIRTAPPYSALHLPWYQDTSRPSDEDLFYQQTVSGISSQWSITDPVLLKNQNTELQHQIAALKSEIVALRIQLDRSSFSRQWRHIVKSGLSAVGLWTIAQRARNFLRHKND